MSGKLTKDQLEEIRQRVEATTRILACKHSS